MTMDLVRIGQLGRAHGVHGEIALDGSSLSVEELERLKTFTWRKAGAERSLVLVEVRPIHGRLLARFSGFSVREQVAELTLGELLVERSKLPASGPGEAYTFELVGLRVVDTTGRELGVVAEVMRTGAHPIWVVRGEREILIPAADPFVRQVDLEAGVVTVALPEGLDQL
jgi:16S rRNA processing protein RimM